MHNPLSSSARTWESATASPPDRAQEWAEALEVSPLLVNLMWRRGLKDLAAMDAFLSPGLRHLAHPQTVPGMENGAQVLAQALEQGQKPAVWGDYDVDGVCASALVLEVLEARGFAPLHHIPGRREEGYGLNTAGVEQLYEQGARLLITVDCGIANLEPVARARELGMTVVVTDHHLPGPELPDAQALVNPRLADQPEDPQANPHANLAGVGVAFLLMGLVNKLLPGQPMDIRQTLDLVALGTLADMVDVSGQNRILVKNGLLLLAEGARPGIRALKNSAGIPSGGQMTAGRVGFGLGPRINAAGRMGSAEAALELLRTRDSARARVLAAKLEGLNDARRDEEERIARQALEQAERQLHDQPGRCGLVVHGQDWHPGVVGIVASRVVEAHNRPTLVLTLENGLYKGSGRSTPEVDLHAGLNDCADMLKTFGGHRQAAGLSLTPDNLEPLAQAFHAAVERQLASDHPAPRLHLDADLDFRSINARLLAELALLQPFCSGNPEPVFHHPGAQVRSQRTFGEKHVSLDVREADSGITFTAKAWRMAAKLPKDLKGKNAALAFTPKLNSFRGLDRIELQLKDLKVVG